MKRLPGFAEGVVLALLLSASGAALFVMFSPFIAPGFLLRALIAGSGFCYMLYLLWRSRVRVGRVITVIIWVLLSLASWLLISAFSVFLLVHLGMLWLVRAFYFHDTVLTAVLDLALGFVGLALAVAAGLHSESIFAAVWVFFLCQALFIYLPRCVGKSQTASDAVDLSAERFEHAHRVALAAVHKLSTQK